MARRVAYRPQAEDTTAQADRVLMEAYRRLDPAAKWRRVAADSGAVARLAEAGRRLRGARSGARNATASVVAEEAGDDPLAPALRLLGVFDGLGLV